MTNTTAAQVAAMQKSFRAGTLTEGQARSAIDAARSALEADLPPILALNAASSSIYGAKFVKFEQLTKRILMEECMNGLMAANDETPIGPHGLFTLVGPRTESKRDKARSARK